MTATERALTSADEAKACCAASYGNDAVTLVLGESYHPGGLTLTRRLAERLRLRTGHRVVDVASGPGATARLLAADYGVTVDGIELGETTVPAAREATAEAGLSAKARFHLGDAERIPLPSGEFDAVICECAFCTFPDKATAAAEFARLLRPGGRIGITDVTITDTGLPDELSTLAAWVACIADAKPLAEYRHILADAGLTVTHTELHDDAIARMVEQIDARIRLLRMTARKQLDDAGVDVDAVLRYCTLAKQAIDDGLIGYALLIAERREFGKPLSATEEEPANG